MWTTNLRNGLHIIPGPSQLITPNHAQIECTNDRSDTSAVEAGGKENKSDRTGIFRHYKNDKAFPEGTAVFDMERGKLGGIHQIPWQTDDAIGNRSWGYAEGNTFKSAQYVILNLVDIVSKNGNLLLNVGPRSDGTITEEETQTLLGTGEWLHVNGEAIYGTRPWKIFGEGPTESASGSVVPGTVPTEGDSGVRRTPLR